MVLPEEVLQKYQRVGRMAREVREEMRRFVREGMLLIDVCRNAESLIRSKGGQPAFPCNVSVNEIAAHYTSPPGDQQRVPEKSLVKVDIGVHIDGYIADTATTICFNPEYESLVSTAEKALEKAVEILQPELSMSRFGSTIQKTIETRGLKPVSNLTGHLIGRYTIHAGKSLPNVFHVSLSKVNVGEVYGVEPFVTLADAAGKVSGSQEATIFRFSKRKSLKNQDAKRLLGYIQENFKALPFAERWLQQLMPESRCATAFAELLSSKSITSYPVFIEASGRFVAQAEHTVLITEDGCLVLT